MKGKLALALAGLVALVWFAAGRRDPDADAVVEAAGPHVAEVHWDVHGVPHVRAQDARGLMRAFGWAQAKSHGEMLLRILGEARGRAAEHFGADFLASDRDVWTAGIPERAARWYEEQDPEFRDLIDAFAGGINDYAARFPGTIDGRWRRVLPIRGEDVLAHAQRLLHFGLVARATGEAQALRARGSNAWAIAGSRSENGVGMLLANPHLPWTEPWTFYEAHLECPEYAAYGAAVVGLPVLAIAFHGELGWTHTLNTHDGADHFAIELVPGGYRFDGVVWPLAREVHELRVRGRWWGTNAVRHTVESTVHGPVIAREGNSAIALRVVGLDRPHVLRQWWEMGRAKNLAEFEAALALEQLPTFTVVYADREGHVLHQFGGLTPARARQDLDWGKVVPGTSAETLWTDVHPLRDLPRVLDPASGWVHSANDPPWSATAPSPLDPAAFPPYVAPQFLHLAAQRSLRTLLAAPPRLVLADLERGWSDSGVELAERVLPDLLALRADVGEPTAAALDVLAAWDRRLDRDSRGAVLFAEFAREWRVRGGAFRTPWDPASPLETPQGIADLSLARAALDVAAEKVAAEHSRLDIEWGAVHRLRAGPVDLPCSGGDRSLGVLRVFEYAALQDGTLAAVGGDTFVAAVEFTTPLRARVLMAHGNASQPGGTPRGPDLERASRGELRDALLTSTDIERATVAVDRIPPARVAAP
ncbi:MAG: acylase [Planctomycetaceae bacterium]|nr:acylase [Planctomycetaceae bacterium]